MKALTRLFWPAGDPVAEAGAENLAPRLGRLVDRHRPVEEERSILWTKPRPAKTH